MTIEITAEVGVNHQGKMKEARRLIHLAKVAGANAVKFQAWVTDRVYEGERAEAMRKLELSRDQLKTLKSYSEEVGIEFFATPDELDDAKFLADIGVKRIKTSSADVTNLPLLRGIAKLGLPVIFSTGACTLAELSAGVETILEHNGRLTILHCVSAYPAPLQHMNLNFIPSLRSLFYLPVGLSDHTIGNEAALMALALGARMFEKHFTIDKEAEGPDHAASLTFAQMQRYVASLRAGCLALGDGQKKIMPSEQKGRRENRRVAVAAINLEKGDKLTADCVLLRKSEFGMSAVDIDRFVGKQITLPVAKGEAFTVGHFSC